MAQVSIIQFAEITTGAGRPIRFGSKDVPSVITLTGTGDVIHRVYNDIAAPGITTLFDDETVALKWWAIKSSIDVMMACTGSQDDAGGSSALKIESGVWHFFNTGVTTEATGVIGSRIIAAEENIATIKVYNESLTADIEFVAAY